MDFAAAESYLADLQMFGIKLGLENVKRLAEYAGVGAGTPALAQMHFIHIAGSNGKGSTGAMLEAMLRKTGSCTGFYSSPHLIVSRERIRINGCAVAEAQWGEAFDTVYAASERMRQEGCCPTYFEFQTVLALVLFAAGNVEWVIWETGMGGRLDATNFIPECDYAVITGIALEHCRYLGDSIAAIAGEKAGIIKPGCKVFAGIMPAEALQVIAGKTEASGAYFYNVSEEDVPEPAGWDGCRQLLRNFDDTYFPLALAGAMQRRNCALALKVWENIAGCGSEKYAAGISALADVRWPCRFEFAGEKAVIDGGHNPDGIKAFVEACHEAAAGGVLPEKLNVIFGAFADKDAVAELRILEDIASSITFVPVKGDGGREACSCAGLIEQWQSFSTLPCRSAASVVEAWNTLGREPKCVCGSLFIAGELLEGTAGFEAACDLKKSWRKYNV